jgi:diguanylate cyclase (GGDEF)-like protein
VTTQGEELSAAIAALWARQRGEMLRRVELVDNAVVALGQDRLAGPQLQDGIGAAHKIAGAAGSFGFSAASEHARTIELALKAEPTSEDAPRLAELVARIRADFSNEPAAGAATAAPAPDDADVLLLCGTRIDADELIAVLEARGLRARTVEPGAEIRGAGVAIVDLDEPGAVELMQKLTETVVIGIARDPGLDTRVAFTRSGGRTLLPADVTLDEVAEAAMLVREGLHESGARILLVDDDPAVLELTTTILAGRGLEVTSIDDPAGFWHALETRNPDVLLLDLEMPSYNGIELCRAVRADPRWSQLPILFLTGRTEPEAMRAVFDAGADDCLTKPVDEATLVQRIENRLERVRQLRDLADRDALTGVANRRKASEQLTRLERIAKRYGQPLTLAILDIDHFKSVNDSYGHDMGDEVLRRLGRRLQNEFRGEDVVGRWGGEEFVVGMYGMPGRLAIDRLGTLLEQWKDERFDDPFGNEFTTSFTVGLAELPGTAASLEELQLAADDALYRGKAAGRSRVQMAGARGDDGEAEQVDIALVDDDPAIVDLLTHALRGEGWSVRTLDDGEAAIDALAADPPALRARLVLLDWNLPGHDGFAVLQQLRDRGVLGRTRVVMLTALTAEAEVVRALELGATDHVAKPFSVPVLLQKLRHALETR